MLLYCFSENKNTEHTKRKNLQYYCNICDYTNGIKYNTLDCDSK